MKIDGSITSNYDQQAILPEKKMQERETGGGAGQSADSITINYKSADAGDAEITDFEEAKSILQYVTNLSQQSGDLIGVHNPISADRVMQLLSMDA